MHQFIEEISKHTIVFKLRSIFGVQNSSYKKDPKTFCSLPAFVFTKDFLTPKMWFRVSIYSQTELVTQRIQK